MKKLRKKVFSPPSIRLNTLAICEVVLLLALSLGTLFIFARQALVKEAKLDAQERLQGTQQCIDNILLDVEQASGNIYHDLMQHLDQPDEMWNYCQRLVLSNPNINGCAIAFKPDFYPDRDHFMAFVRRDELKGIVRSKSFGHGLYTEQNWYLSPMKSCRPTWLNPIDQTIKNEKPIITFCLPLINENEDCVGVMAVGLLLETLSKSFQYIKTSSKIYSILLDEEGTFIVHPNKAELLNQTVFTLAERQGSKTMMDVGEEMVAGKEGNRSFKFMGETWYIFYKPFERQNVPGRSMEELNWSLGTVYPKSVIFNEYNHHLAHIGIICIVGLLIFYIATRIAIRKQLKPLRRLTESALSMAEGNFATMVPETERRDEVGQFQQHFKKMQDALIEDIENHEKLTATLNERRDELRKMHEQIEEDNRVQTTLLHNITNRMIPPTESIRLSIMKICDNYQDISNQEVINEVNNIREQSEVITELLKKKFDVAHSEATGKEESHE